MKIATAQYDLRGYLAAAPQWLTPEDYGYGPHDNVPVTLEPGFWHRTRMNFGSQRQQLQALLDLADLVQEQNNGTIITIDRSTVVGTGADGLPARRWILDVRYVIEDAGRVRLLDYVANPNADNFLLPGFRLQPDPLFWELGWDTVAGDHTPEAKEAFLIQAMKEEYRAGYIAALGYDPESRDHDAQEEPELSF